MKSKIAKNYLYNVIYQILTIFLPLITTPYLSRVLGAEKIGVYGYTLSIATYFTLFGALGIALYGQREIAYVKDNRTKRSKVFFELFFLKLITMSFAIMGFYIFFCQSGDYSVYFKILLLEMVANILDISWFFQGIEEFKKTVLRNTFIKIISLISIFVFVHSPEDLYKYFLIYVLSNLLGNMTLWLYLPKYISKIKLKILNFRKHFKPIITLFIPQIAAQVYLVLDKVMIGAIIADKAEVGYYEQAQKLVKIFLVLTTSLATVMLSRSATLHANQDKKKIVDYTYKSIRFSLMLNIPIMFGLISIASTFVPIFYGPGYEPVVSLLYITSPVLIFIGMSSIIGTQYLLATDNTRPYTASIVSGAIINFILNIFLIRYWKSIGATVATVIAEFCVVAIQIRAIRNQIKIREIINQGYKYLISAAIMFIASLCVSAFIHSSAVKIIIQIFVSTIIYFASLLLLRDNFVIDFLNNTINKILRRN